MDADARTAKADARVAKARARALRPWYARKRVWLGAGVIVVIIVAIAAGSQGSNDTTPTGTGAGEISSGLGSQDATADIANLDCGQPDAIGITYPTVTVINSSSKASNYVITIVAESADGSLKYDETPVFITSLQPGQTMTEQGMFTNELPAGAVCKVTEVQRTAA